MASSSKRGFLGKILGRRNDKENIDYDSEKFEGYYGSNQSIDEESVKDEGDALKVTSAYHSGRRTQQSRGPLSCPGGGGPRGNVVDYMSDSDDADNISFRAEMQRRSRRRKSRTNLESDDQSVLSAWNVNERRYAPENDDFIWLQTRNEQLQRRLKASKEKSNYMSERYRQEKRKNKELEEKLKILTEQCTTNDLLIQSKNHTIHILQNELSSSFRQFPTPSYQQNTPNDLYSVPQQFQQQQTPVYAGNLASSNGHRHAPPSLSSSQSDSRASSTQSRSVPIPPAQPRVVPLPPAQPRAVPIPPAQPRAIPIPQSDYSNIEQFSPAYQTDKHVRFAEAKKAAVRRLTIVNANQANNSISTPAEEGGNLYENQAYLRSASSCERHSASSAISQVSSTRSSQNPRAVSPHENDDFDEDSVICMERSPVQSFASMNISALENEEISPRSTVLSPIDEDEVTLADSASQVAFRLPASLNATPRSTGASSITTNRTKSDSTATTTRTKSDSTAKQ